MAQKAETPKVVYAISYPKLTPSHSQILHRDRNCIALENKDVVELPAEYLEKDGYERCIFCWDGAQQDAPSVDLQPFGLRPKLMSTELKAAGVGLTAVPEAGPYAFKATGLPSMDPGRWESYMLLVTPKAGLCAVMGIGRDISSNSFGHQLSSAFRDFVGLLQQRYNEPTTRIDRLEPGSIWKEPGDWMMGLKIGDRTLVAIWKFAEGQGIAVQAKALSSTEGYLSLRYEFSNHAVCQAEIAEARRRIY